MPEGWVLDAHQDGESGQMSVWIKEDGGKASLHLVPKGMRRKTPPKTAVCASWLPSVQNYA